ncbi:MAG TPA: B12-binding domain-containing radical SAM protein [Caldilineae bacterium]|nr:B12-binding domain-containing radical SAM protein [Caldilineae bacterium]
MADGARILFVLRKIDYEPQGIMQLAAVLKGAGHKVELTAASHEDPVRAARRFRPDILAYSVFTGSQREYLSLNARLKEATGALSVFGGPHPTFFPEIIEEDGVDVVCIGEGEGPILDLANALASGAPFHEIPNLWVKQDGQIHRNPVRSLITDLDTLPLPDRSLVYDKDRFTRESGLKHFVASRGCPYLCTFCFNQAMTEIYGSPWRRVRRRSVEHVLEEIDQVRRCYPLSFVVFLDDLFIVPRDWLEVFAREYPRRIGLPFFCNVRANLVDKDLVRLLKSAGCVSVGMGIETGDDRLRNIVLKRNLSREQLIQAADLIHDAGIALITTNMLGLPTGTLEDDFETLELNIACRAQYANAFLYQPYPRTELGEFAREAGLLAKDVNEISTSAWDRSILRFPSPRDQRMTENLVKLFALAVAFPRLRSWLRYLVRAPRNPIYWLAYKLWKGYAIKRWIHPYRSSPREFLYTAFRFMQFD